MNETPLTDLVPFPRFAFGRLWSRKNDVGEVGRTAALRDALSREKALHLRLQSAMEEYETLQVESHHRLSNNLQMIVSLLMMQSRAASPECAPQLAAAARRVMTIEKIHHRLHSNDGTEFVPFKKYLQSFCTDIAGITDNVQDSDRDILVSCDDILLPTKIAIPLGFIINELITNAMKYGKGSVRVRLEGRPNAICALSVTNDGPPLPEGYDPAASKGLGMNVVQSFVRQIGGEFQFGRGDGNQGAQFTVLFPECRQVQGR